MASKKDFRRFLSPKNALMAGAALALGALIFIHFKIYQKGFDDIIPNIISDIVFAIFVVYFIEYANNRDRQERNRARRRALARAVQAFYQNLAHTLDTYIADGVISSKAVSMPSVSAVAARAKTFNVEKGDVSKFEDDPIPIAAFFICDFVGSSDTNVFPPRTAREYISQLTSKQEQLYRDVFYFDSGFLPDEVVDVLSQLKNQALFVYGRSISLTPAMRIGYWVEDEIPQTSGGMSKLRDYFAKELGYVTGDGNDLIKDAVANAINRQKTKNSNVGGA
jgi:hypothetical protein